MVDRFHGKLPKEELKKFAREVNKKLVSSDYKNNRVEDPTSIPPKQAKKVRKYAHDFFDRAVAKYTEHEKKKAHNPSKPTSGVPPGDVASSAATPAKDDVTMSDVEADTSPGSSAGRKRKRDGDDEHDDQAESPGAPPSETPSVKRIKEDDAEGEGEPTTIPPPPTPPPPPADTPPTEEDRSMREQEEALMRENEEAQRLEDEAQAEEGGKVHTNGTVATTVPAPPASGRSSGELEMGGAMEMMDTDEPPQQQQQQQQQRQQQAVLGH